MTRPVDPIDIERLTALKVLEKRARQRQEAAEEGLALWRPRVDLARRKGVADLVAEAEAQVLALEEARRLAQSEAESHAQEREVLLAVARQPEDGSQALANAESLLEDFQALGVNPSDEALRNVAREVAAEDMLAALKRKMQGQA